MGRGKTIMTVKTKNSEKAWKSLLLLFGLALLVRFIFCFLSGLPFLSSDSSGYIRTATNLLERGKLGSYWPPGYPIAVAAIYALFGESAHALIVFNCFLGAITVVFVFLIARIAVSEVVPKHNGQAVGALLADSGVSAHGRIRPIERQMWELVPWLAALAVMFHPNVLNYTRQILSETLAATMLAAALYFALKSQASLAGLFMGLCLITRPSGLFITPSIIAVCALRARSGRRRSAVAISVLMFVLVVFPVSLNASLQAKTLCLISNNGPTNIYQAVGLNPDKYEIEWNREVVKANFPAKPEETAVHYYFRFAATHTGRFAKQRFLSLYQFFAPWPLGARPVWKKTIFALFRIPTYVLATVGVVCLFRKRHWDLLLAIVGPTVGLALMHTAFYSAGRHIAMVEPLIMVAVALGSVILIVNLKASRKELVASSEEE